MNCLEGQDPHKLAPRDHKTIAPAIYTNMRGFNCRPQTAIIFSSFLGLFTAHRFNLMLKVIFCDIESVPI